MTPAEQREHNRVKMARWRAEHHDEWLAYQRAYHKRYRQRDIEKARAADRARYARDGERIKERARAGRAKQAAVIAALKDRPCADCGQSYHFAAMEFDHLPGHRKNFNIARGIGRASLERLVDEIAKCEVVCSNCHAIRTWRRMQP